MSSSMFRCLLFSVCILSSLTNAQQPCEKLAVYGSKEVTGLYTNTHAPLPDMINKRPDWRRDENTVLFYSGDKNGHWRIQTTRTLLEASIASVGGNPECTHMEWNSIAEDGSIGRPKLTIKCVDGDQWAEERIVEMSREFLDGTLQKERRLVEGTAGDEKSGGYSGVEYLNMRRECVAARGVDQTICDNRVAAATWTQVNGRLRPKRIYAGNCMYQIEGEAMPGTKDKSCVLSLMGGSSGEPAISSICESEALIYTEDVCRSNTMCEWNPDTYSCQEAVGQTAVYTELLGLKFGIPRAQFDITRFRLVAAASFPDDMGVTPKHIIIISINGVLCESHTLNDEMDCEAALATQALDVPAESGRRRLGTGELDVNPWTTVLYEVLLPAIATTVNKGGLQAIATYAHTSDFVQAVRERMLGEIQQVNPTVHELAVVFTDHFEKWFPPTPAPTKATTNAPTPAPTKHQKPKPGSGSKPTSPGHAPAPKPGSPPGGKDKGKHGKDKKGSKELGLSTDLGSVNQKTSVGEMQDEEANTDKARLAERDREIQKAEESSELPMGLIAGIGATIAVLILVGVIFFFWRKRQSTIKADEWAEPERLPSQSSDSTTSTTSSKLPDQAADVIGDEQRISLQIRATERGTAMSTAQLLTPEIKVQDKPTSELLVTSAGHGRTTVLSTGGLTTYSGEPAKLSTPGLTPLAAQGHSGTFRRASYEGYHSAGASDTTDSDSEAEMLTALDHQRALNGDANPMSDTETHATHPDSDTEVDRVQYGIHSPSARTNDSRPEGQIYVDAYATTGPELGTVTMGGVTKEGSGLSVV